MIKTDVLGFYKLGSIINEMNAGLTFISTNITLFASPLDKNLTSYYSTSDGKPVQTNLHVPFTFERFDLTDTETLIEVLKEKNLGLGIGVSNSPVIKGIQDFDTKQYLSYPVYNPDKKKFIQYCRYLDMSNCKVFDTSEEYYDILSVEANFVFDGMLGLREPV